MIRVVGLRVSGVYGFGIQGFGEFFRFRVLGFQGVLGF